ncbi:unnamed protein product [Bursaphelenchus xylophilus]|uniref:(pine wood nematode) hypothetical protein n=1 Tax=Bursaphelenchus xylophilus TaxID=6326 RepID=A0A1I7RJX1_BURXY|nr:unnamed protein product [Bursaphelenchus xylophilus]CAG9129127.1 unnamed protein product [Bursaphelenchus xylophilus]
MGNSSSSGGLTLRKSSSTFREDPKLRRTSRSVRVPSNNRLSAKIPVKNTLSSQLTGTEETKHEDIQKSHSMYELRKKSNASGLSQQGSIRLLTPQGNGSSDGSEADVTATLMNSKFAATSIYPSMCRQKSFRRLDPTHPLSPSGREIVRTCFENPHLDLGNRICSRVFERRPDFQRFIANIGKDKWPLITNNLQNYLEEVVVNVDNIETVQRLSRRYGEEHVALKSFGFKPDIWVSLADACTVECVILDMASHAPTDTVAAWSQFVSVMFSSIRDGYYNALRAQRMSTRKSLKRQESVSTQESSDNSTSKCMPQRELVDANANYTIIEMVGPRKESFSNNYKIDRPIFE